MISREDVDEALGTQKPTPATTNTDLGEANAVMFTNYKRPDGFEVSFTLRSNSGKGLMERFEAAITEIKKEGGTPIPLRNQSFAKSTTPPGVTKPCPKHPGELMKERISKKDGAHYFSHSKGVYPNLDWCSGKGYTSELEQKEYPERDYGGEY